MTQGHTNNLDRKKLENKYKNKIEGKERVKID
jgi:hypothetical protein